MVSSANAQEADTNMELGIELILSKLIIDTRKKASLVKDLGQPVLVFLFQRQKDSDWKLAHLETTNLTWCLFLIFF